MIRCRIRISPVVLILSLLAFAHPGSTAWAAERNVPGEYTTIQAAIDACATGDVVIVAPGTYTGTGNRNISFAGKAITVRSTDPNDPAVVSNTIVDCQASPSAYYRGFVFATGETNSSVLAGLTIRQGWASGGGGILCQGGSPTITNCVVADCGANGNYGGGIYCSQCTPMITNCTIRNCAAMWQGGGICCYDKGHAVISNCTITGSSSGQFLGGGGIHSEESNPQILNSRIIENSYSCGISLGHSNPIISQCDISNNKNGHGIASQYDSSPTISDCTFLNNQGAGIYCYATGTVTITGCTISGNQNGGGINCTLVTANISDCNITGNTAGVNGGGIWLKGQASLTDCTVTGNSAGQNGGGIGAEGNTVNISRCTINNNHALTDGGGVWRNGGLGTLSDCSLNANYCGGNGSGFCSVNAASPVLERCWIMANAADEQGGGVYCSGAGKPILKNSMICMNRSTFKGGGVFFGQNSAPTLDNCTIVANSTTRRGGGIHCSTTVNGIMANTIVWGNTATAGPEIAMEYTGMPSRLTVSYSDIQGGPSQALVEPNCLLIWGDGNIDADPMFLDPCGPDNDPNTWQDNDYHIMGNSPCKNAGDPNGDYTDQTDIDGQNRVIRGRVDIGADENPFTCGNGAAGALLAVGFTLGFLAIRRRR